MQYHFAAVQSFARHFILAPLLSDIAPERSACQLIGRHSGIRAEGVIFYEREELQNGTRIFGAHYYKDKGRVASLSADGIRALASYLQENDKTLPKTLRILSNSEISAVTLKENGARTVSLPPPSFEWQRVGLQVSTPLLGQKISLGTEAFPFYALFLHGTYTVCFRFGTTLQNLRPASIALPLSVKQIFSCPFGAVFAEITGEDTLSVRVFDTEEGELDSTSEGAAAAVAVAHLLGLLPIGEDITVRMRGGCLSVRADYLGAPLSVTADTRISFEGTVNL